MKKIMIVMNKKHFIFSFIPVLIMITLPFFINRIFFEQNVIKDKIIVIDAGHGGVDGGAYNTFIKEKDVNLDVALRLQKKLENNGAKVIMTRITDTDLSNYNKIDRYRYIMDLRTRLDIINNSSADIFISIHTNSNVNNPTSRGIITYYYNSHPHNKGIAYIFQNIFNSHGFEYMGKIYKSYHFPQKGRYFLLVNSKIPGVIVETGFITNKVDLVLLKTDNYKDYIAEMIYKGILNYLSNRESLLDNYDN